MRSVCTVDLHLTFNNIEVLSVAMETQECVPSALLSHKIFRSAFHSFHVLRLTCKCPTFLSDFNQIWGFLADFRSSSQHQISHKSVQFEPRR